MVDALVRACVGKVGDWPRLLPYALALDKVKEAIICNKGRFDQIHCLRPKTIEEGYWVMSMTIA